MESSEDVIAIAIDKIQNVLVIGICNQTAVKGALKELTVKLEASTKNRVSDIIENIILCINEQDVLPTLMK